MKIGGFLKLTLIDYPGELASEIFCKGCNFRCLYCHNYHLIYPGFFSDDLSLDYVYEYLAKNKNKITGLVISGGEPLLQKDIAAFLKKIKSDYRVKVKIDTNGYETDMLKEIIKNKLADCVAMDIKASPDNYSKICGVNVNVDRILDSANLLMSTDIKTYFRMTVVKNLTTKNDIDFAKKLVGDKIIFQNYKRPKFLPANLPKFDELSEIEFSYLIN